MLEWWCILRMVRIVYDLSQQIRVCARMYIGIIWRFGNCKLRHCLGLESAMLGSRDCCDERTVHIFVDCYNLLEQRNAMNSQD